jgi:hypothetical protein
MEEYDEYGEIKAKPERILSQDQKHRIHQTKDLFDGECSYCQTDAKKWAQKRGSWWEDDE